MNHNHVPTCTCDKEKIQAALNSITQRKGMTLLDKDGKFVCTQDSFGFRSELPGECKDCYEIWKADYLSRVFD